MPTREEIIDLLWEHSYKKWRDGYFDDDCDDYPEYLANRIMELLRRTSEGDPS